LYTNVPSSKFSTLDVVRVSWIFPKMTVSGTDAVIPWKLAEIFADPAPTAVAAPVAATVATLGVSDAHVTEAVIFCVDPSVYVPVALNVCVCPTERLDVVGAMEIDESGTDGVTVSVAVLDKGSAVPPAHP
jgi:hypothetical protein